MNRKRRNSEAVHIGCSDGVKSKLLWDEIEMLAEMFQLHVLPKLDAPEYPAMLPTSSPDGSLYALVSRIKDKKLRRFKDAELFIYFAFPHEIETD